MGMILWLFLGALIGGTAAHYRGFSNLSGIVIGALLGPASVLMFLASSGRRKCSQCQEWIQKKAKICPFCKSDATSAR